MKILSDKMTVPVYVKTSDDMEWPNESMFYILSKEGIFLCRNHKLFNSAIKVDKFPEELAGQESYVEMHYPKIRSKLIGQVIGFFESIAKKYHSEAGVILYLNKDTNEVEAICPEQKAGVSGKHAIDLEYEIPNDTPSNLLYIGDIHSHVYMGAYASGTDTGDEIHRPGLHIVIGKVDEEPPQFHCEVVVDGERFTAVQNLYMEPYKGRYSDFPDEWLNKITVKKAEPIKTSYWGGHDYDDGHSYGRQLGFHVEKVERQDSELWGQYDGIKTDKDRQKFWDKYDKKHGLGKYAGKKRKEKKYRSAFPKRDPITPIHDNNQFKEIPYGSAEYWRNISTHGGEEPAAGKVQWIWDKDVNKYLKYAYNASTKKWVKIEETNEDSNSQKP